MMTAKDVRLLRTLLGLKQGELAEKIGVSFRTIQNYEASGVIPPAKQKMLSKMLEEAQANYEKNNILVAGNRNTFRDVNIGGNFYKNIKESLLSNKEKDKIEQLIIDNELLKKEKENLEKEVEHLKTVISEKERLIQVLMNK